MPKYLTFPQHFLAFLIYLLLTSIFKHFSQLDLALNKLAALWPKAFLPFFICLLALAWHLALKSTCKPLNKHLGPDLSMSCELSSKPPQAGILVEIKFQLRVKTDYLIQNEYRIAVLHLKRSLNPTNNNKLIPCLRSWTKDPLVLIILL